jgi:hypothetical protein
MSCGSKRENVVCNEMLLLFVGSNCSHFDIIITLILFLFIFTSVCCYLFLILLHESQATCGIHHVLFSCLVYCSDVFWNCDFQTHVIMLFESANVCFRDV